MDTRAWNGSSVPKTRTQRQCTEIVWDVAIQQAELERELGEDCVINSACFVVVSGSVEPTSAKLHADWATMEIPRYQEIDLARFTTSGTFHAEFGTAVTWRFRYTWLGRMSS